jgi:hypothetical protein
MYKTFKNTRYYRWNNDDMLEEIRIVKFFNENSCNVIVTKGNDIGKVYKINVSDIEDNYTKLIPDGYINFSIVTVGKNTNDVMVTVSTTKQIDAGDTLPEAVCRQAAVDLFAKQLSPDHVDYAGISISKETCPADVDFVNFFACNGYKRNETVSFYIGDTLDDILKYMDDIDKYDSVLLECFNDHCVYLCKGNTYLAEVYKKKDTVDGYCKSLTQLLDLNNFAYDLYRSFNIIPTNFSPSHFNNGVLSVEATEVLSSILTTKIAKSLVVKYDKDVDLSWIKKSYCLVADNEGTVYVVAYIVTENYHVPVEKIENDENIKTIADHIRTSDSVIEAYNHLNFKSDKYEK